MMGQIFGELRRWRCLPPALNAEVVIIDTSGKAFMKIAKAQRRLKALLFLLQRDSEHLEGHR